MSILLIAGSPAIPSRSARLLHHVGEELRAQRFRTSKLHLPDVSADLLLHANFGNGDVKPASEWVAEFAAFVIATPDVRQVPGQRAQRRE